MRGFNAVFNHALAGQGIVNAALTPAKDINTFATTGAVVPGAVPTAPGPKDVFKEGGDCKFAWTPDPSGQWKEMNVQLMSGNNWNMIPVTTIVKLDGTSTTNSYTFPCPDVKPNSAIYFYQFSTPAAPKNLTWTTRFTIAAADGSVTTPANDTQPDGQKIPWGVGALVDQSKVVPPPSYLTGGSSSSSASSVSSSSATASSSGSISASASASVSSSTASSASSSASVSASSASASSATSGPASSSTTSGAHTTVIVTATNSNSAAPSTDSNANSSSGTGNGAQANVVFGTVALGLTAAVFALLS